MRKKYNVLSTLPTRYAQSTTHLSVPFDIVASDNGTGSTEAKRKSTYSKWKS